MLADRLVVDKGAALNALSTLSDVQEVGCSFAVGSVQSATYTHLFAFLFLSNFSEDSILLCESNFRVAVRLVQSEVTKQVGTDVVFILNKLILLSQLFRYLGCLRCFSRFLGSLLVSFLAWLLAFLALGCLLFRWLLFLLLLLRLLGTISLGWFGLSRFRLSSACRSGLHDLHSWLLDCGWCVFQNVLGPLEVRCKTVPRECVWMNMHVGDVVSNGFDGFLVGFAWLLSTEPLGITKLFFDLINHFSLFFRVAEVSERELYPRRSVKVTFLL